MKPRKIVNHFRFFTKDELTALSIGGRKAYPYLFMMYGFLKSRNSPKQDQYRAMELWKYAREIGNINRFGERQRVPRQKGKGNTNNALPLEKLVALIVEGDEYADAVIDIRSTEI